MGALDPGHSQRSEAADAQAAGPLSRMTAAYVRFWGVFQTFCDSVAVGAGNGAGHSRVISAVVIE